MRRWDLATARLMQTYTGHRGWVEAVRFAPGGGSAFSAGGDGRILKWDLDSGEIRSEKEPGGWLRTLAISPDGSRLCVGGEDHRIHCRDLATGERTAVLRGHQSHVLDVAFIPGSRQLVSRVPRRPCWYGSFPNRPADPPWRCDGDLTCFR